MASLDILVTLHFNHLLRVVRSPLRRRNATLITAAALLALAALALTAVSSTAATNLLGGDEPLSPQEAFVPSVAEISTSAITLSFDIADGYYLYRDKTSFEAVAVNSSQPSGLSDLPGIALAAPEFPPAIIISDEFFGEQATFRDTAAIILPYSTSESLKSLSLSVKFQGCADMGLCYPPTTVVLDVDLPAQSSSGTDTQGSLSSPLINVKPVAGLFGDIPAQDELLPPELAYLPQIMQANDREMIIRWQIEPGYYLYRDKLSFSLTDTGGAQVVNADIDPGVEQYDEFFGDVRILRDVAEARLNPPADLAGSAKASLQINYQGCADIGVCFPPSITTLPVAFDSTPSGIDINAALRTSAASSGSAGTATGEIYPGQGV